MGRSSGAGLSLQAEGVSREHAAIVVEDGAAFLEDLGSTNGTRLNGERLSSAHQLRDGDVIGVGRAQLTVQLGTPQQLPASSDTAPEGGSIALTHRADAQELARLASDDRAAALLYQLGQALTLGANVDALARRIVEIAERTLDPGRVVLELGGKRLATAGEGAAELVIPADAREPRKPVLVNLDASGKGRPEDVVSALSAPNLSLIHI